ncbi:hypothetical protein ACN93_12215 [Gordonia paraffinivorans]|nr:hypothetical protein ACN93_12215 [Gordonia paraffinivorans]
MSAWVEPAGILARGTVIVLTGRGETASAYQRFARRISADAYRVRIVEVDESLAPESTRAAIDEIVAGGDAPEPRILVGSDTGAALAATLVDDVSVDAAVLAGIALPTASAAVPVAAAETALSWDDEIEARSACPAHRKVLTTDERFRRGALSAPRTPDLSVVPPSKPTLVIHGTDDPVTPADQVVGAFSGRPRTRVRTVVGGRHDILNDVSHRSVAATIVLFLESLKLGADLPDIVRVPGA